MKRSFYLGILQLFVTVLAFGQKEESWYLVALDTSRIGDYYVSTIKSPDTIETVTKLYFVLKRNDAKTELTTITKYIENARGNITDIFCDALYSNRHVIVSAHVNKNQLYITNSADGNSYNDTVRIYNPIISPGGIERLTALRLKKTGDKITYFVFDPELRAILKIKRTLKRINKATLEITEEIPGQPANDKVTDLEGKIIRSSSPAPGGTIIVQATDKEKYSRPLSYALLAEAFNRTLKRSNIRLANARSIDEMVIEIKGQNARFDLEELNSGNQVIIDRSNNSITLRIFRPDTTKTKPCNRPISKEYFEPNVYISSNDSSIIKASQVCNLPDTLKQCECLKNFVVKNIQYDLSSAMAPATEVIKELKASCVGQAILLASLFRAKGFPSRYVSGAVYSAGAWSGHAWAEVFCRGEWFPFDAAVDGPGVADAARIRLASSSLKNSAAINSEGATLGDAEIRTLSYTIGGKTSEVKQLTPYTVSGNRYVNEGLNLSISIPDGFRFERMNEVWPSPAILSIAGPGNERINFSLIALRTTDVVESCIKSHMEQITGSKVTYQKGDLFSYSADKTKAALVLQYGNEYILAEFSGRDIFLLKDLIKITRLKTPVIQ